MTEKQSEKKRKSLALVKNGETARLVTIEAGQQLNSRLTAMGLVPNVNITVISNGHPGPFVVSVKQTKMILGRGMAHKIIVK